MLEDSFILLLFTFVSFHIQNDFEMKLYIMHAVCRTTRVTLVQFSVFHLHSKYMCKYYKLG